MPFKLGVPELVIILIILLLLFGATRLPQLGNSLGKAIRGLRSGLSGEEDREEEKKTEAKARKKKA